MYLRHFGVSSGGDEDGEGDINQNRCSLNPTSSLLSSANMTDHTVIKTEELNDLCVNYENDEEEPNVHTKETNEDIFEIYATNNTPTDDVSINTMTEDTLKTEESNDSPCVNNENYTTYDNEETDIDMKATSVNIKDIFEIGETEVTPRDASINTMTKNTLKTGQSNDSPCVHNENRKTCDEGETFDVKETGEDIFEIYDDTQNDDVPINAVNTLKSEEQNLTHDIISNIKAENNLCNNNYEIAYECGFCEYVTENKKSMADHVQIHTGERGTAENCKAVESESTRTSWFICNDCGYSCKKKSFLITHIRTHAPKETNKQKNNSCPMCNYSTVETSLFNKHLLTHANKPDNLHGISEKSISRKEGIKDYRRNLNITEKHGKEKQFLCVVCGFKCSSKSILTLHQKIHAGEKSKNIRKTIHKPYDLKNNIDEHKIIARAQKLNAEKTLANPKLVKRNPPKKYGPRSSKSSLEGQRKPHSDVYSCTSCDYKCKSRTSLAIHHKIHSDEKPFICNYCDHKCKLKGNLIIHIRQHTGEKPYLCEFCYYRCCRRDLLKTHLRQHTGEKPYECAYCAYSSTQKTHLNRHITVHTGVKPYSCKYCIYKTCAKARLLKHESYCNRN